MNLREPSPDHIWHFSTRFRSFRRCTETDLWVVKWRNCAGLCRSRPQPQRRGFPVFHRGFDGGAKHIPCRDTTSESRLSTSSTVHKFATCGGIRARREAGQAAPRRSRPNAGVQLARRRAGRNSRAQVQPSALRRLSNLSSICLHRAHAPDSNVPRAVVCDGGHLTSSRGVRRSQPGAVHQFKKLRDGSR